MYYIVVVIAVGPQYPSTFQLIFSHIHHPLCSAVIPISVIGFCIHRNAITFLVSCTVKLL
jgi:hypothetical protein